MKVILGVFARWLESGEIRRIYVTCQMDNRWRNLKWSCSFLVSFCTLFVFLLNKSVCELVIPIFRMLHNTKGLYVVEVDIWISLICSHSPFIHRSRTFPTLPPIFPILRIRMCHLLLLMLCLQSLWTLAIPLFHNPLSMLFLSLSLWTLSARN